MQDLLNLSIEIFPVCCIAKILKKKIFSCLYIFCISIKACYELYKGIALYACIQRLKKKSNTYHSKSSFISRVLYRPIKKCFHRLEVGNMFIQRPDIIFRRISSFNAVTLLVNFVTANV